MCILVYIYLMNPRILLTGLACVFVLASKAQNGFQKSYGGACYEFGYGLIPMSGLNEEYLICGSTTSYGPNNCAISSAYLVKTGGNGDTIWSTVYGHTGLYNTSLNQVLQLSDGGYLGIGTSQISPPLTDIFVMRCNSAGDTLWTRSYGGTDDDFGTGIARTTDNGFVITGYSKSFGIGVGASSNIYVAKMDSVGNLLWSYAYSSGTQWGWEFPSSIIETSDKGFFIPGHTSGSSFGTNPEAFGLKLDSLGNVSWCRIYGGSQWDYSNAAIQTKDGGYLLIGSTTSYGSSNQVHEGLLIKTDMFGAVSWSRTYERTLLTGELQLKKGQELVSGNYILSGFTNDSANWMPKAAGLKIDPSGNLLWANTYCPPGYGCDASDVKVAYNSGFVFAGTLHDSANSDLYLFKTDSNGFVNASCAMSPLNLLVKNPVLFDSVVTPIRYSCSTIKKNAASFQLRSVSTNIFCSATQIPQKERLDLLAYPNPAEGYIRIVSRRIPIFISVVDLLGKPGLIKRFESTSEEIYLDITAIENGIYFITITSGGQSTTQKLIVQH